MKKIIKCSLLLPKDMTFSNLEDILEEAGLEVTAHTSDYREVVIEPDENKFDKEQEMSFVYYKLKEGRSLKYDYAQAVGKR